MSSFRRSILKPVAERLSPQLYALLARLMSWVSDAPVTYDSGVVTVYDSIETRRKHHLEAHFETLAWALLAVPVFYLGYAIALFTPTNQPILWSVAVVLFLPTAFIWWCIPVADAPEVQAID